MKKAYTNTIHGNKGPLAINKSTKQRMPACSYGSACTRPGCVYRHPAKNNKTPSSKPPPPPVSTQVCKPFLSESCLYGNRCTNRHPSSEECKELCATFKQRKCMYNATCRSASCLFFHDRESNADDAPGQAAKVLKLAFQMESMATHQPPPKPLPPTFDAWVAAGCETPDPMIWIDTVANSQRIPEDVYALLFNKRPAAPPSGWAAVAATPATTASLPTPSSASAKRQLPSLTIPSFIWSLNKPPADAFHLPPPDRYAAVNANHALPLPSTKSPGGAGVVDLHFQSLSTFSQLLTSHLEAQFSLYSEVWVITGSGHHVATGHQTTGGVLWKAVKELLEESGRKAFIAKDGAGNSGAFLVLR